MRSMTPPNRTTLLDDQAVAERVLAHVRDGTTDRADEVWLEPVASYRSEKRFRSEIETVLRRTPTAFCPSAAIPDAGSYIARQAAGTPLLVVRGEDGRVRAFRNACRHRGTEVTTGSGCAKAFVCPYHGWAYGLDGRLKHIPHADGFPGLDQKTRGLSAVRAEERLGLVFVTQNEPLSSEAEEMPWDGMPQLITEGQELMGARETEIAANWKVNLEGFIEGYHIRAAHKETFYPYGYDNLNLVEHCGRNSRVTYPFRRIEKLRNLQPESRNIAGMVTYVYQLFPNVTIAVLSNHTTLTISEPLSPTQTRFINYRLTNKGDQAEGERAQRDASFVSDTGGREDAAVIRAIQESLASGANEYFTYGKFEKAIVHFHRTLSAMLQRAETQ